MVSESNANRKQNPEIILSEYDYDVVKRDSEVNYYSHPYGYVSSALPEIGPVIWDFHFIYGIFSDTGTGKNTFLEKSLISSACKNGRRVLLFTNRVALGRQTKRRIAELVGMKSDLERLSDLGLDEKIDFGNVTIVSYQQLESMILNNPSGRVCKLGCLPYDWVVCDEAHYFLSDATFNGCTGKALDFILYNFNQAVKLFMTATPEEIFPVLKIRRRNLELWRMRGVNPNNIYPKFKRYCIHEFEHDFSYLDVCGFTNREDIFDLIKKSDEKYLVFIEDKKIGKSLVKDLGKDGSMLTAESKSGDDIFDQIVKEERFSNRVLVTTSVLENGVNIRDKNLRNVVIFCNDKVKFLQMLGRIRREEGQRIKLFVSNITEEEVEKRCSELGKTLQAYETYWSNPVDFAKRYINSNISYTNILPMGTLDKRSQFSLNYLGYVKYRYFDLRWWEKLREAFSKGESYPGLREKFSWVEKEFSDEHLLPEGYKEQLVARFQEYLETMVDIPLDEEHQEQFKIRFRELHDEAYGVREKSKKKGPAPYGPAIIKSILEEQDLPYELETTEKTQNRTWCLKKN